jgi:hypothetical protein
VHVKAEVVVADQEGRIVQSLHIDLDQIHDPQ